MKFDTWYIGQYTMPTMKPDVCEQWLGLGWLHIRLGYWVLERDPNTGEIK